MISYLCVERLPLAEQSQAYVVPADEAAVAAFGSALRRAEALAWRAVVRRELGTDVQIAYNAVGAPVVNRAGVHIGVSHSRDFVAVAFSEHPCAVDVERAGRNFRRVLTRYMTPAEQTLSACPLWPAVAWCAKETLYKLAGRKALDLRQDLHLTAVDWTCGEVVGQLPDSTQVTLHIYYAAANIVVYVV